MPVLRRFGGTVVTSRPPKRILPPVGSRNPAMSRKSVVFPQPEGPSRKNRSPEGIARSTPSTAIVVPKRFVMDRNAMSVMGDAEDSRTAAPGPGAAARYHARMARSLHEIEALRRHRERPERDVTIAGTVRGIADGAARAHERIGAVVDVWREVVPPELEAHTRITAFRGGVLNAEVDSAAALYRVDRWLRSDGLSRLRERIPGTLTRVRLRRGEAESS